MSIASINLLSLSTRACQNSALPVCGRLWELQADRAKRRRPQRRRLQRRPPRALGRCLLRRSPSRRSCSRTSSSTRCGGRRIATSAQQRLTGYCLVTFVPLVTRRPSKRPHPSLKLHRRPVSSSACLHFIQLTAALAWLKNLSFACLQYTACLTPRKVCCHCCRG